MILLTRPKEDALTTSNILSEMGWKTLIDPMIEIMPISLSPLNNKPSTLIFTSRNGVKFCPAEYKLSKPKVFVVGDSTYLAAEEAGFKDIENAKGSVEDLYQLVIQKLDIDSDTICHVSGEDRSTDLVSKLRADGYKADEVIAYKAKAAVSLSDQTISALKQNMLRSALFFSSRTATIFLNLIKQHQMSNLLKNMTAFCISPEVAEHLREVKWEDIKIAKKPTQKHILELIN